MSSSGLKPQGAKRITSPCARWATSTLESMIHPTAIVHAQAQIGSDCIIGPYCVIDQAVVLGNNCTLGPHIYLTGKTILGANNNIHAGAVIGDLPQDLRFKGQETGVVIGENNIIREHATIHRSNNPS